MNTLLRALSLTVFCCLTSVADDTLPDISNVPKSTRMFSTVNYNVQDGNGVLTISQSSLPCNSNFKARIESDNCIKLSGHHGESQGLSILVTEAHILIALMVNRIVITQKADRSKQGLIWKSTKQEECNETMDLSHLPQPFSLATCRLECKATDKNTSEIKLHFKLQPDSAKQDLPVKLLK